MSSARSIAGMRNDYGPSSRPEAKGDMSSSLSDQVFRGDPAFRSGAGPGARLLQPWCGAGLDLAGNWAPVFHEDAGERGPRSRAGQFSRHSPHARRASCGAQLRCFTLHAARASVRSARRAIHVYRGPLNLRIWEERDPVTQDLITIKQYIDNYEQTRTIWMDGRPHPSEYAPHTWMGFSTGEWQGDSLTVTTTHIKRGWIRRNGLRSSDQAVLTEHFIRHGKSPDPHHHHRTIPTDLPPNPDPQPGFHSRTLNGEGWLYPCDAVVEVERPRGAVPHYLPGKNLGARVRGSPRFPWRPPWAARDHVSRISVEMKCSEIDTYHESNN